MSSRAQPMAILPLRDGDPAVPSAYAPSQAASADEILRCAESLGIPWRRLLVAEIEAEQKLRRYVPDLQTECPLATAQTVLSFALLQSWRIRDRIESLACQSRGGCVRGAVREIRLVFQRLTGKGDRDQVALARHFWFAYQRILLLQRVMRYALRSRGTTAERLAFVCSSGRLLLRRRRLGRLPRGRVASRAAPGGCRAEGSRRGVPDPQIRNGSALPCGAAPHRPDFAISEPAALGARQDGRCGVLAATRASAGSSDLAGAIRAAAAPRRLRSPLQNFQWIFSGPFAEGVLMKPVAWSKRRAPQRIGRFPRHGHRIAPSHHCTDQSRKVPGRQRCEDAITTGAG